MSVNSDLIKLYEDSLNTTPPEIHTGGGGFGGGANAGPIVGGTESSKSIGISSYDELYNALTGALREQNNELYQKNAEEQRLFNAEQARLAMDFDSQQAELNRQFQQESADKSMQFSAEQAQIHREWLEEMSNSAYTRSVADMKNAGLNPILLATKGFSGASTPSVSAPGGAQASGSSARGYMASGSKSDIDTASYIVSAFNNLVQSASSVYGKGIEAISRLL